MFQPVRLIKLKKPLVIRVWNFFRNIKKWLVKDC